MNAAYRISSSRACRLVGLARSGFYYEPKSNPFNQLLTKRIKEISSIRIRFGYQRIHTMLRREGWQVNRKRVRRLYVNEGLQLRRKKKRTKRSSHLRVAPAKAGKANERWSMDFVTDRLESGGYFRILTVVDQFTRECLAVKAGRSLRGRDVAKCLSGVLTKRDRPKTITVDNGSEFYSQEMDAWAYRNEISLDFIRPGKPVENAFIESFNGRLRDECLNTHVFFDLLDAQEKLDHWQKDYNEDRPHSSLGELSPAEFAKIENNKKQTG